MVLTDYAEHFADNQANWNDRAHVHMGSAGYGVDELVADPQHLHASVAIDRERLGDLAGRDVIHLQCHLGTDTLCLKRLGARRVVGVDLSEVSLDYARQIAHRAGEEIEYVHANVFDAVEAVGAYEDSGRFDLVYTGIGALGWLPDLKPWGMVVADLLRPGGRFFIREDHPVSMMLADEGDLPLTVGYSYFNEGVLSYEEEGTYVEDTSGSHQITHLRNHWWNHPLQDIFSALIEAGLVIDLFEEEPYAMWRRFGDASVKVADGQWAAPAGSFNVPLTFVLRARKPA